MCSSRLDAGCIVQRCPLGSSTCGAHLMQRVHLPLMQTSDMATAFLRADHLSKSFGETHALQDVSIDIEPGKVHTVLGENGSGKSTLVKVLSGIMSPDSGTLRIAGTPIAASSPADMLELGVAVVLQEVLVAPNRAGVDNVLLGRDSLFRFHAGREQKKDTVKQLLATLTTRDIDLEAPAGELPLNEQQVLVIARGFAARPRLLILDEVTAALDLTDRNKLFDAIRAFSADGGAVVFVSHRMPEIMELSDVVFIMHNGRNTAQLSGENINPKTLLAHLTQEFSNE